jgi:hypothetical protein
MAFHLTPNLRDPTSGYEKLLSDIYNFYSYEPADDITLDAIEYNFKKLVEGPYQIVFTSDKSGNIFIQLSFQSEEECLLWVLKNA